MGILSASPDRDKNLGNLDAPLRPRPTSFHCSIRSSTRPLSCCSHSHCCLSLTCVDQQVCRRFFPPWQSFHWLRVSVVSDNMRRVCSRRIPLRPSHFCLHPSRFFHRENHASPPTPRWIVKPRPRHQHCWPGLVWGLGRISGVSQARSPP